MHVVRSLLVLGHREFLGPRSAGARCFGRLGLPARYGRNRGVFGGSNGITSAGRAVKPRAKSVGFAPPIPICSPADRTSPQR